MTPRLPALLLGLGALGACATAPDLKAPPAASAADRHEITVEESSARLELKVAAGDVALSHDARAQVQSFASGYLRYGHGALILSSPEGAANANAADLLAREARVALAEAGVAYAAVASSDYDAAGQAEAPLVLSFTRYEAQAPECAPLWTQDLAHQSDNRAWESFGCATQANLAALVEDPHDLLAPRAEAPRDSNRRATVMERYRQGQPTHATRSADERAQVSTVGQ